MVKRCLNLNLYHKDNDATTKKLHSIRRIVAAVASAAAVRTFGHGRDCVESMVRRGGDLERARGRGVIARTEERSVSAGGQRPCR